MAFRSLLRRGSYPIHSTDTACHDIIDVSEVALQLAAARTLKDLNWLALLDLLREVESCHVGSTPGAVHSEEPQANDGEAIDVLIAMRNHFVGFLRCCIQAGRVVHA